jgi:hypothetical protein
MVRRCIAALAVVVCSACGNAPPPTSPAPASPPPPPGWAAGAVLTVISGVTGEPIVGAQVRIAGTAGPLSATTDARGEFRVGTAFAGGSVVTIDADAFFQRLTLVRPGETSFVLWPNDAYIPTGYTWPLVYVNAATNVETPLRRLARNVRTVRVRPGAELRGDESALNSVLGGIELINAPLEGLVTYAMDAPSADVEVVVSLNPAHHWCSSSSSAFTLLTVDPAGALQGGTIVGCSASVLHSPLTIAHELGHTYGLQHSTDSRDIMSLGYARRFTSREALTMRMMAQRRPGNRWPDNDTGVSSAGGWSQITVE